jgi:hypothetical protein
MASKTIKNIVGIVAIGIISFLLGIGIGLKVSEASVDNNTFPEIPSIKMLNELPIGGAIEIELEEGVAAGEEFYQGEKVKIEANKDYARILSWWGLGATEAAAKDQGLDISKGGLTTVSGQVHGYGALEQLWSRIKSMLWLGGFTLLALFVMMFIPVTAPIAGAILRGLASIIPFVGSLVERTVGSMKWKKPLNQTIAGGQEFKRRIIEHSKLDEEEKKDVIRIFRESMLIKQDMDSQGRVKEIKYKNGFA